MGLMMGKVVLDGESVDFQGTPPSSVSETWALLEKFLSQSGLLIESMRVDGQEWFPERGEDLEAYRLIEVFSITQEQSISNTVQELLGQREATLAGWRDQARRVLRCPWGECQTSSIEVLNATQPLLQCVGLLVEYSMQGDASRGLALKGEAESLNEALSLLMDAFEEADCIAFSDLAEGAILPRLDAVYRALSEDFGISQEQGEGK